MSAQYYYQVSALPLVRFGEPAPLSWEDFVDFCERQLPEAVAAAVAGVSLLPDRAPCCEAEEQWQVWETYLRNVLARWRAARLGTDASAFTRPDRDVFPGDRRRVEEILGTPDPLQREIELDRLRWQRLDDLAVTHTFDLGALVIYALRLHMAWRWTRRSEATGWGLHERLLGRAVGQAEERRREAGSSGANGQE